MNNIKVSVIVPIYNVEEYLNECLDSLVDQTIDSMEVLMIDDGSPDRSGQIAQEYEKKYENFYYIKKENGGLGQARNFGINYAHGEYIAFLDSDDLVAPKAYEKMYDLAKKMDNDLVVGDVVRFNSKKVFNSNLHRRAFNNAENNTHILRKPELVYDTTSWNKLYRLSWWKKNNFHFPEKILYEDIPVTIPAHFKANSVSILNDIVYYWRVRDGVSKSITQNRTDQKNFYDRLKIMKMVDEFYEKNVTDNHAQNMKNFKWLDLDLKLYINQFGEADDEYIDFVMTEIKEYVKNIPSEIFSMLRAIDQMKYYLIQRGEKENLLKLLRYEKTKFKTLRIKKKGDRYIGDYSLSYIPKYMYDMTAELNNFPVKQKIQEVSWNDNTLYINGYVYLNRLEVPTQTSQQLIAYLKNVSGDKKIPIDIEVKNSVGIKGTLKVDRGTKSLKKYNYKWAGYKIAIDFSKLNLRELENDLFRIEIMLSRKGIKKYFYLGQPVAGQLPRENSMLINGFNVHPDYNLGYDIIFNIKKPVALVETVSRINNEIVFEGTILKKNKSLCIEGDQGQEFSVSYAEEKDGIIKYRGYLNSIFKQEGETKITSNLETDSVIFVNCKTDFQYIFVGENMRCLYKGVDGSALISNYKQSAIVKSVDKCGKVVKFSIAMPKPLCEIEQLKLLLSDSESGKIERFDVETFTVLEDGLDIEVELDLESKNIFGVLTKGLWEVSVMAVVKGKGEIIYPVMRPQISKNIEINTVNHRYTIFTDKKQKLCFRVSLVWKKYENTAQKRRLINKYIYPILRILPINKKRIIFEGWWGQKYHCNPRYLYEYIDKNYPEYECVWSMVDENTPILGKGRTVRRDSLEYHFYMATSKYFVNNVNFKDSFEKRKNQIEVQTMHGTPLKTLGLDVPGELPTEESRNKFLRRCGRWDYLIVQSKEAENITSSCFAYRKEFLKTGYPRNDIIFEMNNATDICAIKQELGIPIDKKVIMYAPTWRRKNQFDLMLDIDEMRRELGDEYVLLLRIHPFAIRGFDSSILNEFVYNVSSFPSIEKLYVISDIFITDYSSAMFDYGILNRPILFFVYDLESYRDNLRGFNINLEKEAPGPLLNSSQEVIDAINNIKSIVANYDEALQKFRKKYCEYEIGEACKQIMQIVWKK